MFSIHGFAGTNVSPSEKMALPERALHVPYGKMALPERDKPLHHKKPVIASRELTCLFQLMSGY